MLRHRAGRLWRAHHLLRRRPGVSRRVEGSRQRPFDADDAARLPGIEAGRSLVRVRGAMAASAKGGAACAVVLEATHEATLKIVPFELLIQYAVIPDQLH